MSTTIDKLKNLGFSIDGLTVLGDTFEEVKIKNKRPPGRYPPKGWQEYTIERRPVSGGVKAEKTVTLTGPVSSYRALWESSGDDLQLQSNKDVFAKVHSQSASFCGGTRADLSAAFAGQAKMDRADAAKSALESSDFAEKLTERLSVMFPKRRRVFGDEGQWVEGRRWDGDAFEDFRREPAQTPALNLRVIAGENCHVSAEKLERFGAMIWAVTDKLEEYGVRVNLNLVYDSEECWINNGRLICEVPVKAAGEYLSPSFMVGVVHPNFFRRAIFTAIVHAADCAVRNVCDGLGRAAYHSPVKSEGDTLTITSSGLDVPERVVEEIIKAIQN